MKKLTLFFAAASVATTISAQQLEVQSKEASMTQAFRNAKVATAGEINLQTYDVLPKRAKIAASVDTAFYLRPDGSFFGGWLSNGNNTYPRIYAPAYKALSYYSVATTGNTWSINSAAAGTAQTFEGAYPMGAYYLPTLTSAGGNTYMYGESEATQAFLHVAPAFAVSATTCAMYASTTMNSNGNDCYMVGAGSYGSYAYGTDLTVATGKTADTLGVLYDNMDIMYVDSIYLPIYNKTATSVATMIPAGANLQMTAYKVNETTTGYSVTSQVLATATATAADVTSTYSFPSGGMMAVVSCAFKTTNALGLSSATPVAFDGPFYIELTGYNAGNCDFGIYSDYYYPVGQTYFTVNGNMTTLWSGGGNNIAMTLNTIFPALEPDTTNFTYTCPDAGGYAVDETGNAPLVYTNFSPLAVGGLSPAWQIENTASWLTVQFDTTYYTSNDAVFIAFSGEALPATLTGRAAAVTVNVYGKKLTYIIKQGDGVNAGVNTTAALLSTVTNINGNFSLNYPAEFSSVDVYNVSGQQMGHYELPTTGNFVIPNSNSLSNGMYIFKMVGTTTEVLRAVK